MTRSFTVLSISISIFFIILSILAFTFPLFQRPIQGDMTVEWSSPKGVRFNDLEKGDELEISFTSDNEIGIFLLTQDEADRYRSPAFYRDRLPVSSFNGSEGTFTLEIEEDGDFEVLFWNETFRSDHVVQYEIDTHIMRHTRISMISGSSLLFLSLMTLAVLLIRSRTSRSGDPPDIPENL